MDRHPDAWRARKRRLALADGGELAFVDGGGPAPALLLLHGFSDTSRSFSLLEPHLRGWRLVIPDLRGHGDSSPLPASFTLDDHAADMAALADALSLGRVPAAGHSMGSLLALRMAAREPERAAGLVLLAGALALDLADDHPVVAGIARLEDPIPANEPFFDDWHACDDRVPRDFLSDVAREARAMPAAGWRSTLAMLREADMARDAASVTCPVLALCGEADPLFGQRHRRRLAGVMPGAIVRVLACGHNPHWEAPAEVAAAMAGFLVGVESSPASESDPDSAPAEPTPIPEPAG